MNHQRTGVPVLARFPDVQDGTKPKAKAIEAKGWGLLTSRGRWISQAMSIKLLAGMTLFLLVGAVLPFCLGTKPSTTDLPSSLSPSSGDTVSIWPPSQVQTPVEAVPPTTATVAASVARRPAVLVSATSEQLPAPATLPVTASARREPTTVPTVAESLLSPPPAADVAHEPPAAVQPPLAASNWSPPPGTDLQPEVAARPGDRATEYNADTRVGQQPQR